MAEAVFQKVHQEGGDADGVRQRKAMLQDNRNTMRAGKLADDRTVQLAEKSNNTGLPDSLKHGIESLSGMSMDNVKVHYNSAKPAQLNAHAYAQGTDIHLAPGQEKHLPHEAWHVVQQAQGRVKPTMQMKAKTGVPQGQPQSFSIKPTAGSVLQLMGRRRRRQLQLGAAGAAVGGLAGVAFGAGSIFPTVISAALANSWNPIGWGLAGAALVGAGAAYLANRRPMDGMSRLRRAHARAANRDVASPRTPLGKRQDVDTSFGTVGLSRQPFNANDPQITTSADDFPGTRNPGARYEQLGSAEPALRNRYGQGSAPTTQQERAAAALEGITQHAEPRRFAGADKPGRQAMRNVGSGRRSFSESFGANDPDYPMAAPGGAHSYDQAVANNGGLTPRQNQLLEDMSESSDDES